MSPRMAAIAERLKQLEKAPEAPTIVVNFDIASLAEALSQRMQGDINPRISPS